MNHNVGQEFDDLKEYDKEGWFKACLKSRKANVDTLERKGFRLFLSLDVLDAIHLFLIPIVENGKYGFIDKTAKVVIDPIYDDIYGAFFKTENYVAVKKGNYWSAIDHTGKELLEFKFKMIFPSRDSSLISCEDYWGWSVINLETGDVVVNSGTYKLIEGFRYGYARVKNNGKWGIINTEGRLVLDTEYESMYSWYEWVEATTKIKKSIDDKEVILRLDTLK